MSKKIRKKVVWGATATVVASGFWLLGRELSNEAYCVVGIFFILAYVGWLVRDLSAHAESDLPQEVERERVSVEAKERSLTEVMAAHSLFHLNPHSVSERIAEIESDYSRQFAPLKGTDLDFDREIRQVGDRVLKDWLKERKSRLKKGFFSAEEMAEFARLWALTTRKVKNPFKSKDTPS
jgi:5'-3' exonuclease